MKGKLKCVAVFIDGLKIDGTLVEQVSHPTNEEPYWIFYLKNGSRIEASGNVMVEYMFVKEEEKDETN